MGLVLSPPVLAISFRTSNRDLERFALFRSSLTRLSFWFSLSAQLFNIGR